MSGRGGRGIDGKYWRELVDFEAFKGIRGRLSERELFILDRRLLAEEPMTLRGIGAYFGRSNEVIRQQQYKLERRLQYYCSERGRMAGWGDIEIVRIPLRMRFILVPPPKYIRTKSTAGEEKKAEMRERIRRRFLRSGSG